MLPRSHAGLSRAHIESARLPCAHGPVPGPALLRGSRVPGPCALVPLARCPALPPAPARVMDGRGAGCLSGLIDEVCADSRRVTLGGRRRARGGGRAQTQRRSGSAPGRQPPPLPCSPARLRGGGGGRGSASRAWRPCSSPASSPRSPGFPPGCGLSLVREPTPLLPSPLSRFTLAPSSALTGVTQSCAGVRGRGDSPRFPGRAVPFPSDAAAPLRRIAAAPEVSQAAQFRRRIVGSSGIIPARRERRKIRAAVNTHCS